MQDNAATMPRTVSFVPGNLFFTRTLELPEGMRPVDVPSFAELTLEEMSPFSLEHLAWGYQMDASARWLLIVAACQPRLPVALTASWDEALFVLPAFYPLLCAGQPTQGAPAILYGNCLTLAHYGEQACPLPTGFTHHLIETDGDPLPEAFAIYASERPSEAKDSGLFVLEEAREGRDGTVAFDLSCVKRENVENMGADMPASAVESHDGEPMADAPVPGQPVVYRIDDTDTIWPTDLRDSAFKASEQKSRRLGAALWKGMLIAGAVAAVLLLLAVGWAVLAGMVSSRQSKIAKQTPQIMALELKEQNLEELKQFAGSPFRPFTILEAVNDVKLNRMGKNGVYFDSVALNKDNEVTIRGKAGSIVEVNQFADALTDSGLFEQISPPDYQSRGSGEVRFTLELRYLPPPSGVDPIETVPAQSAESQDEAIEPESASEEAV
ncbi:PilN domain-containing protein [Ruficoccus sp. ZRK36]|uniref:PilN domain-containing protein n=1 Tax=Ruficoccus sp. ZRK36 TaxID=2866311 RepID=UPI001C734DC8|nr:PilN domain-containing protein [Ruficoccus sp. ZRK36]QYY34372.1 PilN domain-containing protein [Ruficoccus sp. ZRK36]